MALSIKTAEADDLARRRARLTGETMTHAVTEALRERLARETARRTAMRMCRRVAALVAARSGQYDKRPVSRAEWDAACGDED
jgi:antitoxin VapB